MHTRGIRGAITIEKDSPELMNNAVVELFREILEKNDIKIADISHLIFTVTKDIKCAFPAKFVRQNFDAKYLPMMCMPELDIENSLEKCIRLLVVVNTEKSQEEIKPVYLKGAKVLRPDVL